MKTRIIKVPEYNIYNNSIEYRYEVESFNWLLGRQYEKMFNTVEECQKYIENFLRVKNKKEIIKTLTI